MSRLITYIKDTRGEMKHVSWPTRRQAINFTLIVIGISLAIALLLGLADFIFVYFLELFL